MGQQGPRARPGEDSALTERPPSAGVVLGLTLYNNARFLPEALDSILAQSDPDFAVIAVDDGSGDGTREILASYAARDSRIQVVTHPERQGMVATWRQAFAEGRSRFPRASYFAWVSDHDRWHPEWLRRTRAELDAHPEAVLAYSRTLRIDEHGGLLDKGFKTFQTAGLSDPGRRWAAFSQDAAGAGDLVYGLMRAGALERAGVFRPVLLPDRLLMLELTLQGEFRQVPEVLWFRRQFGTGSVDRQRRSLFTPANAPGRLWQPPWLQHARLLSREYVAQTRPEIAPDRMRSLIRSYVLYYLVRRHSKSGTVAHGAGEAWEDVLYGVKVARTRVWTVWYEGGMAFTAWRGRTRRHARQWVYNMLVGRRRVRARLYESFMSLKATSGRGRRAMRRGIYHLLMLTHRLGLRRRSNP